MKITMVSNKLYIFALRNNNCESQSYIKVKISENVIIQTALPLILGLSYKY